jgi:hypothetical protein
MAEIYSRNRQFHEYFESIKKLVEQNSKCKNNLLEIFDEYFTKTLIGEGGYNFAYDLNPK